MIMPTVISTLDQVASQVRSSARGGKCVLVHVAQPHRTMSRKASASDHLQVVVLTRGVLAFGKNNQALEAQDADYRQTIQAQSTSQQELPRPNGVKY